MREEPSFQKLAIVHAHFSLQPIMPAIVRAATIVAAVLACGCAGGVTPVYKQSSFPPLATLSAAVAATDSFVRAQVPRGFSGVLLIAVRDSVVLHRAYSADSTIDRETAFWIGSLSKSFAAAAILKLQEQGRLSVHDPISRHVRDVPADKGPTTIHQLLTHTSGLGHRYAADGITSLDEAVRAILALPLEREPGAWGYSNDGYSLLAAVVSMASGTTYETYVQRYILDPSGMRRTGFWGDAVCGRSTRIAAVRNTPSARMAQANWGFHGATGICSTAADLLAWHRALASNTVLADSTRRLAFTPHVRRSAEDANAAYAYGWMTNRTSRGTALVFHPGSESGLEHYASLRRYVDENIAVVFLSNAPRELTWEVHDGVLTTFFSALRPSPP